MFKSVLVANRGEIAVRICKTLRRMGIRSVVVASIPDRRSLAVRSADAWVLLEGYSAAESYLDIDAVIAAAKAEGCEAIHPGYGFLSERADFAERCAAEGIVFVGPQPEVLRGMGDKAAARRLAVANGVPVVPGWDGEDDAETLTREATRIGYPVMLKARGGGGGRGMREVFTADELPEAIESARREAVAAFGDGGLLLEKLVTNAHHVEVQVLADSHGNVIHLGERDCSVQRRHQKLIEETPSPVVNDALRERLTGYALTLARAINYVNAGTFEFLVTSPPALSPPSGEGEQAVYFLEVNPRLQVEHPVTEMVTGLDLVELQLRVAAGEPLSMTQAEVRFEGHAIEFRINAEDPWDGFKPSSGRIESYPAVIVSRDDLPEPREDTGYAEGDSVPAQYDSLVAKRVVHSPERASAINLAAAVLEPRVDGLRTNEALHVAIAADSDFRSGAVGIDWLERAIPDLLARNTSSPEPWGIAAAVFANSESGMTPVRRRSLYARRPAWIGAGPIAFWIALGSRFERVEVSNGPGHADVRVEGSELRVALVVAADEGLQASVAGHKVEVRRNLLRSEAVEFEWQGHEFAFRIVPPPPLPRRAHAAAEGVTAITAPLAGTIAAVRVSEGDAVNEGQPLVLLEAMKMEHRIVAPAEGTVKVVNVRERDVVREGDLLVELG